MWAVIHLAAFNYREGQEKEYVDFYKHLADILVCENCIKDYKDFMENNPPDFNDLFGWTVKLHNHVNTLREKPTYTRKESFQYWRKH